LGTTSEREGWIFFDLWDWLPASAFADSVVHYDADAANALALFLLESIHDAVDDGR
jgi:hypothetical protein